MQHNKNIMDDLEYLSELGHTSFPETEKDVNELKQKIRERSGSSFSSNSGFIVIAIALFVGVTVFFYIYNSPLLFPSYTQFFTNKNDQIEQIKNITLDTIQITGKIKKPEVTEKFEEPVDLDTSTEWGKAEQLSIINPITIGMDSAFFNKHDLKLTVNAPYIFLHDLKVADYNGYYFNTPQRIIVHGSLSADKATYNEKNDAHIPYREYYLHDVIKDAMYAFKQKHFSHAISLFDLISTYSKNDVNCDFYRGMGYYQLHDHEQAYLFFKEARANKINVFAEETDFYLALSAIKTNRVKEGEKLLKEIADLNGFYSLKAKQELSKL